MNPNCSNRLVVSTNVRLNKAVNDRNKSNLFWKGCWRQGRPMDNRRDALVSGATHSDPSTMRHKPNAITKIHRLVSALIAPPSPERALNPWSFVQLLRSTAWKTRRALVRPGRAAKQHTVQYCPLVITRTPSTHFPRWPGAVFPMFLRRSR